jgi:hypothetical protein
LTVGRDDLSGQPLAQGLHELQRARPYHVLAADYAAVGLAVPVHVHVFHWAARSYDEVEYVEDEPVERSEGAARPELGYQMIDKHLPTTAPPGIPRPHRREVVAPQGDVLFLSVRPGSHVGGQVGTGREG